MFYKVSNPAHTAPIQPRHKLQITADINEAWDSFKSRSATGHHLQTSLWGQLKSTTGWRSRLISLLDEEGGIVGGAQVLIRPLFLGLSIGYVAKGPTFAQHDEALFDLFMTGLRKVMRRERMVCVIVQPFDDDTGVSNYLKQNGFTKSPFSINVDATVKVDLTHDIEQIMANFKSKTRYNIRLGKRKGVTVRLGNKADLPAFHDLLKSTGERQNFTPYPLPYFYKMWDLFAPNNHIKLFMTYFQDELVSANLSIAYGETMLYKKGAWAGRHGNMRPNEVMHWEAIQWAKENGYKRYDFEGIALDAAKAILSDEALPKDFLDSTTRFKLGFGKAVIVEPAQIYTGSRLGRWVLREVVPWINERISIKKIANRFRSV